MVKEQQSYACMVQYMHITQHQSCFLSLCGKYFVSVSKHIVIIQLHKSSAPHDYLNHMTTVYSNEVAINSKIYGTCEMTSPYMGVNNYIKPHDSLGVMCLTTVLLSGC